MANLPWELVFGSSDWKSETQYALLKFCFFTKLAWLDAAVTETESSPVSLFK